jgi:hypothetical protein
MVEVGMQFRSLLHSIKVRIGVAGLFPITRHRVHFGSIERRSAFSNTDTSVARLQSIASQSREKLAVENA